jgi:hypothetical protein
MLIIVSPREKYEYLMPLKNKLECFAIVLNSPKKLELLCTTTKHALISLWNVINLTNSDVLDTFLPLKIVPIVFNAFVK